MKLTGLKKEKKMKDKEMSKQFFRKGSCDGMAFYEKEDAYGRGKSIHIARSKVLGQHAEMVNELIERWGMIASIQDGEDSKGRSKLRLMTPQELVDRAMATSKAAFKAIESEGWILDVPIPDLEVLDRTDKA